MRMLGSCHICGKNASQSCSLCGSLTCDEHIQRGVCTQCRKSGDEIKENNVSHTDYYS